MYNPNYKHSQILNSTRSIDNNTYIIIGSKKIQIVKEYINKAKAYLTALSEIEQTFVKDKISFFNH